MMHLSLSSFLFNKQQELDIQIHNNAKCLTKDLKGG